MRVKHFLPFLLLYSVFPMANAQKAMDLGEHLMVKFTDKTLYGDPAAEKVEGTPFLNETFIDGIVYGNRVKYSDVPMRYNIYDDQIEFKQKNQLYILDPNPAVRKVELDNHTYVVCNYESRGKPRLGYFLLLDSGKLTLLSKKVVTFREQQQPKALETGPAPAKYFKAPDVYYYKMGNGELMKLDNIKKMIATFPDKQAELSEFAKKEKISSNKGDELIKLVKYYNSL